MQDRPQDRAPENQVRDRDVKEAKENVSELTENFPHLFSSIGKNNSARDKKACRVPK